jgi:hypothetical protein
MAPAIRRIAVRRPHPIPMPALAKHLGARVCGDRIVTRQERRPRRDHLVQQERDQGARQSPRRPAAPRTHPMLGRGRPRCLNPHGAEQVGDGPSPRGQHGRQRQAQKPVRRRDGTRGTKHGQYWHRTRGNVHGRGPSMGETTAYLPGRLTAISP